MELNSNVIVAIVTIVLCALALTYAMLTVQKSLNAIVCYIKLIANSQAANKTKASGQTEHMRMSTSQKFKAMIIPAALLVLAFCVNNIDKFVDFISPDPIEETNKKLAQIVEGMQPSIQVDLPDSLESTSEVRQIRKFQDEILYFKLYVKRIKSLYENYNNEERILNDKEVVINNISLLTVLVQTNDAYGKAIRTSTSTMLSRVSSKCDVYSVQYAQRKGDEYGKMLDKTFKSLQNMVGKGTFDRNKFEDIMQGCADESIKYIEFQEAFLSQLEILANCALIEIKDGELNAK